MKYLAYILHDPENNVTISTSHAKRQIAGFAIHRLSNGPGREKTCLRGFENNTGADQLAHPRSLISAFGKYHMSTCYR